MAYSTIPKVRRDGSLVLQDATSPTAVTLTVAYEEGNFSFDKPLDAQTVIRDRSSIVAVRKGDEEPISGSFSFFFRAFTSSDAGSVRDFIEGANAYSANISTGASGSPYIEHYAIDMVFTVEGNDLGDSADHTATFSKCVASLSFAEGDPNTWTLNFTAYGGVTFA